MRFVFHEVATLPRLAWCARLRRGEEDVVVWHGPWVERFDDGFAEGAWDGAFREGRFAEAVTFTGTGGCLRGGGVVFASATNSQEVLYLLRRGDELFVSQSFPLVMVAAGDEPDPRCVVYEYEMVSQAQVGIFRRRRTLPTRFGRVVQHECANLTIGSDLSVRRSEKPAPPPPSDYAAYVALLEGAIAGVFGNAADPARRQGFRPLATLSRGYDSPALAVLARRHGCRDAATFAENEPGVADPRDDGAAIGEILDYDVKTYARLARNLARPFPEAEFCVRPPGGDRTWLAAETELQGRIFLSGRHGDIVLSLRDKPHAHTLARSHIDDLGGATMNEYRLRVGYLNFAPFFTGWQQVDAIRAISRSAALAPWSIGGSYDRPIARRILEEAGVPRALFGHEKIGGAYDYIRPETLSEASRTDYLAFQRGLALPAGFRRRMRVLKALERRIRPLRRRLSGFAWGRAVVPAILLHRWRFSLEKGFLFHWGFERIKDRYRLDGSPAASPPRSPS